MWLGGWLGGWVVGREGAAVDKDFNKASMAFKRGDTCQTCLSCTLSMLNHCCEAPNSNIVRSHHVYNPPALVVHQLTQQLQGRLCAVHLHNRQRQGQVRQRGCSVATERHAAVVLALLGHSDI
jgi:hypothetical protein